MIWSVYMYNCKAYMYCIYDCVGDNQAFKTHFGIVVSSKGLLDRLGALEYSSSVAFVSQ
jgi:hypothetical protein